MVATEESQRAAADEETRTAAAAATAAAAMGSAASIDVAPPVDPDAPTGSWPISGAAAAATQRPPGGRNVPKYAAPIAAALVIALGLGTIVLGAGVLGGGAQASPSEAAVASRSLPVPSGVYLAVAGDTLGSIAGKFGVTMMALAAANPGLSPSDVLQVGQIVVVPASEPDPTALQSASPSGSIEPSSSIPPSRPPPSKPPPPTATPQPPPPRDTTAPSNPKVTIKGSTVFTTKVDLTLSATGATQMQLGNVVSGSCDWKPWRSYSKTYNDWPISGGDGGTRTVCVHFRDSASPPNVSGTAKDSTYYDRKPYDSVAGYDSSPFAYNCPRYMFVLDDDIDPDGDSLEITAYTQPSVGGSVTVSTHAQRPGDDVLLYDPPTNFGGADDFTYTVSDGHGGTDVVTVYVQMDSGLSC